MLILQLYTPFCSCTVHTPSAAVHTVPAPSHSGTPHIMAKSRVAAASLVTWCVVPAAAVAELFGANQYAHATKRMSCQDLPWVDVILFGHELDLLRYRLKVHESIFAATVVVEANLTHTYQPKPLHARESLTQEEIERYRITLITVPMPPDPKHRRTSTGMIKRRPDEPPDQTQRRFVNAVISSSFTKHMLYASDVDEILDPAAVCDLPKKPCIVPALRFYQFSPYCPVYSETPWQPAIIMRTDSSAFRRHVVPNNLPMRYALEHWPPKHRHVCHRAPGLHGWHLSQFYNTSMVVRKFSNYIHNDMKEAQALLKMPTEQRDKLIGSRVAQCLDVINRRQRIHPERSKVNSSFALHPFDGVLPPVPDWPCHPQAPLCRQPAAARSGTRSTGACAAAMRIALNSSCPASRWMDVLAPLLAREEEMVFLNIGANKGYAVADFLQRFNASETLTNTDWLRRMNRYVHSTAEIKCGVCGACKNAVPKVRTGKTRRLRAYAVELLTINSWILTRMFKYFNVQGQVVHAAVTNVSGFVFEPRNARPGTEWHMISSEGKRVPAMTMDDLLRSTRLDESVIDLVTIDAEGYDSLVLEGGVRMLAQKRARLIEFEYHEVGMWKTRPLRATLEQLQEAGYKCFWQGNTAVNGALAQASGAAWCEDFEFRRMANLLCSSETTLLRELRKLVADGTVVEEP